MTKAEKIIRRVLLLACALLTLVTVIMLIGQREPSRLLMAFFTFVLILLPEIMERLLHCKLSLPLYIFAILYAIGPMLGHCHDFYYDLPGWDKLLHICGGIMFAIIGFFLFDRMSHGSKSLWLCVIFALCFSMALSMLWEFVEFTGDQLLGMDMQNDTVITTLRSYMLGDGPGVAGTIENIESVLVNGQALPVAGYVDIGLIDTMWDMLLETLGALAVCVIYLIDKGRHPLIRRAV